MRPQQVMLGCRLRIRPLAFPARPPPFQTRPPVFSAAAGIGLASLIMIAVSAAGPSDAVVSAPPPASGPPWWLPLHPSGQLVSGALWTATVLSGGGVIAGVAAMARGGRPPVRALLAAAVTVAAVLTVLPPAGSTDSLDYAAYGRIAALGHSPYVMTPLQLRGTGDPVGHAAPRSWQLNHSSYGPLATAEQRAAAELGGTSVLRITFWLKLWNALAFAAAALALDRLLRPDPARRARAHLIWTANPLLLWGLVAGGHVDGLAAAAGFLGLIALGQRGPTADTRQHPANRGTGPLTPGAGTGSRRPVSAGTRPGRWIVAGVLAGAAADLKMTYILFVLAVLWAARRSRTAMLAAGAGAVAVLVPSYLWFGGPAVAALGALRGLVSMDSFYLLIDRPFGYLVLPHLTLLAGLGFVVVAAVLLRRLPAGSAARTAEAVALPVIQPALALSLAWLLVWPYQQAWYAAMALCLLALYPASRLDWPVLVLQAAASLVTMPGMPGGLPPGWPAWVGNVDHVLLVPVVRLAALLTVLALGVSAAWYSQRQAPVAGAPGLRAAP